MQLSRTRARRRGGNHKNRRGRKSQHPGKNQTSPLAMCEDVVDEE